MRAAWRSPFCVVLFLLVCAVNAQAADGLVGHWTFDDGGGTTALDSSGNGNHGTLTNGPTWTSGIRGGALSFDGVNDYVNCGSSASLNSMTTQMTIALWVRTSSYNTIIGKRNDLSTEDIHAAISSDNRVAFAANLGSFGKIHASRPPNVQDNNWHHLTWVIDSTQANSNDRLRIYIDSVRTSNLAIYQPPALNAELVLRNTIDLAIGALHVNTGGANFFDGLIDDVRIYGRTLSPAEIAVLATAPPVAVDDVYAVGVDQSLVVAAPGVLDNDYDVNDDPMTAIQVTGPSHGALTFNADGSFTYTPDAGFVGQDSFSYKANDGEDSNVATVNIYVYGDDIVEGLVGHWKLDDGSGMTALDSSGNGNHGTLANGPTWATGMKAGALDLDGSDDYVDVPDDDSLDITGELTIAAWIKLGTLDNGKGARQRQSIVSKYNVGNTKRAYEFHFNDYANNWAPHKLAFTVSPTTESFTGGVYVCDTELEAGVWYHVAVVFVPSTSTRIYIGGTEHAGHFADRSQASGIATNDLPVRIGKDYDSDGTFDGLIDDVRIYNRALGDAEIAVLAAAEPIALDDTYNVFAGQTLIVAAPGLLENDYDPNSDPISAALVETTSNGQLWLYADGSFAYVPNPSFVGVDTFTYQATNGLGETSETATVTIVVESIKVTALSPAPDALLSVGPGSIVATFNTGVNPGTVNTTTFVLVRSGGDAIFGNGNDVSVTPVSVAATGAAEATLDLTGVTLPEDAYQVTLVGTGGTPMTDLLGNVLDGEFTGTLPSGDGLEGGDFVATFSVDAGPPTVLSTSPGNATANVDVSADVEVTFSEPMNHASAEAAFSINGGVTGAFSWLGNTMTFHPTPALDDDTDYTVTISTAAQDWLSRPMESPYVFAFTTADAYPPGTPLPPGRIKRMLHLGSQQSDRITGAVHDYEWLVDYFTHAKLGPEYCQQPGDGQTVDLSPSPTTESPMVWTDLTDSNGVWGEGIGDDYVMYLAVYIISPTARECKIWSEHDDYVMGWMDGDPEPVLSRGGVTGGCGDSAPFLMTAGAHSFVFKLYEDWYTDYISVTFRHLDGTNMDDLRYTLVDPIAPRVRDVWPAEGAADVPRWNDFIITFREPMDTTVDPGTVAGITGGSAIGTWSWTSPVHLTWTPASPLAASTTYTVTINRANARDLVGHTLSGANVFTFTTTAASQPIVTATVPNSGESGDALFGVDLSGSGFIEGGIIHTPGALPWGEHYYLFEKDVVTWHNAQDACVAQGGHLATISSAEEDLHVYDLAGRRWFWFGMTDEAQEGNWVWVNGEPVVYTNWASGEPSNSGNEDFGERRHYGWNDHKITTSHTYVCEFDVRTRPSVQLAMAGEDDIVATNVTLVDGGHLTFDLDLAGAAAGDWDVVVTNPDGATFVLPNGFLIQGLPPHVEVLELFYNGQFGDAADPTKMFLAVGEASSMSLVGDDLHGNATNYLHGITGIRVTFDAVVAFSGDVSAAFSYEATPEQVESKVFSPFTPPTAPTYTVDNGTGKTVVTITFADGEIKNRWLKTIIDASQVSANGLDLDGELPSPLTLPSGDGTAGGNAEFIIGNRFGDVDGNYRCLLNDAVLVRNRVSGALVVGICNAYDLDKNERVLLNDAILTWNSVSGTALPALP